MVTSNMFPHLHRLTWAASVVKILVDANFKLAEQIELVICTGCVSGDLHAPPTYRATARTSSTRPDHILVSSFLHDCIESVTVATELKGSDHYSITTSFALPMLSATLSDTSHLGVPLRQVHWKGACRLDYVHLLELVAPALGRCTDLALAGHVEQAMDTLSQVLVRAAHAADMRMYTVRLGPQARTRPHQPFYVRECVRPKRYWRRAGRLHGFSAPLVRGLERH
jgi:hypothetical protein